MRHSGRNGESGRTASMRSIGMNTSAEKNSDSTNQSRPSENGSGRMASNSTVAPPSMTATAAEPTPSMATRRLRRRSTAIVPSTKAPAKPTSSSRRTKPSVYVARTSGLVRSSGKWKHNTPSSESSPSAAAMCAVHERDA